MLDREVIKEILEEELEDIEIPSDVPKKLLTETFCQYMEDDYYEWIKDNLKTFFNYGDPDWKWIKGKIMYYSKNQLSL